MQSNEQYAEFNFEMGKAVFLSLWVCTSNERGNKLRLSTAQNGD